MAIREVPRRYYLPLRKDQYTRNGLVPDYRVGLHSARACNQVVSHLRKMVFTKSVDPSNAPAASSSGLVPWRWLCRTGAASTTAGQLKLRALAAVLPSDSAGAGSAGRWRFVANDGADNFSSYHRYHGVNTGPTINDVSYQELTIDVDPDTEYECRLELDQARVLSLTVWEDHVSFVDTDDTGTVCDERAYKFEADITDAQHTNDFMNVPHNLWKKNGQQLFTLCPESEAGFWSRSATSLQNIIDGDTSIPAPSNSTAGVHVQVNYWNPAHTDNVVCVFGAYAANTDGAGGDGTGAGGEVRLLHETSGTIATLSSFTATASGGWLSTTCNVDGSLDTTKLDVVFKGDGTNTLVLEAVSLYVYVT